MAFGTLFPPPRYQALDADGNPVAGAFLYSYSAGTTTPLPTFNNPDLASPAHENTNPVVADSGGLFGPIYLSPVAYKFVLTDSANNQIWSQDNVTPSIFFLTTLPDGTTGAPSLAFAANPDTGIWHDTSGTNDVCVTVGGVTIARFKPGGNVALAGPLTVNGVAIISGAGLIPAISSTYFASLSGANLTALPAAQLTGTIAEARLANPFTYETSQVFSINAKTTATVYQALSDGLVLIQCATSNGNAGGATVYSDAANPPVTQVGVIAMNAAVAQAEAQTICVPILKGKYWKVTKDGTVDVGSPTVNWYPLGVAG